MARHAGSIAATTLLAVGLVAPTAATAAPTAPPRPTPSITSRADLDGDGRPDRITVTTVMRRDFSCRFAVTVRPARRRAATMPVAVPECNDSFGAGDLWVGRADVDGGRGEEFLLDLGGGVGDFMWPHTYAFRAGKFANLRAPGTSGRLLSWNLVGPSPFPISGYTFSTRKGVRHVVHHELRPSSSGRTYTGTDTTYARVGDEWKRVSVAAATPLPRASAEKNAWGWHGIAWRR